MCSLKKRQWWWGSLQVSRDSAGFMRSLLIEGKVCRSSCLLLSCFVNEKKCALSVSLNGQHWLTKRLLTFILFRLWHAHCSAKSHRTHTNKFLWNAYKLFLFSVAHWDKTRFIQQLETWRMPIKLNTALIFANLLTTSF